MSRPILPSLITCFHSSFSHIRISFPLMSSLSVPFITVIDSLVYPVYVKGRSLLLWALCSKSSSLLSRISLLYISPLALVPFIPLNWVFSKICTILATVLKQINTKYILFILHSLWTIPQLLPFIPKAFKAVVYTRASAPHRPFSLQHTLFELPPCHIPLNHFFSRSLITSTYQSSSSFLISEQHSIICTLVGHVILWYF